MGNVSFKLCNPRVIKSANDFLSMNIMDKLKDVFRGETFVPILWVSEWLKNVLVNIS